MLIFIMSPSIGGDILFLVRRHRRSLLSALYLLNEWMDFGQTYTNLSLGGGKMLILMTLTPFSWSHEDLECWKKAGKLLVCTLSPERMDGF